MALNLLNYQNGGCWNCFLFWKLTFLVILLLFPDIWIKEQRKLRKWDTLSLQTWFSEANLKRNRLKLSIVVWWKLELIVDSESIFQLSHYLFQVLWFSSKEHWESWIMFSRKCRKKRLMFSKMVEVHVKLEWVLSLKVNWWLILLFTPTFKIFRQGKLKQLKIFSF